MKTAITILSISVMILLTGCNKSNNCNSSSTCFVCENCQGQYSHLINGQEKCVDGYDNCEDWEEAKTNYEVNDGCDCQYTN